MALDHDRRPDIVRAIALHELGSSYLARQDAARAMQHYRKALSIARRVGRGDEVAANLIALATAQLRIAPRYRRVARWATAAHSLARRHDDLPHELEACRLLAHVAKSRLDFDGAAAWINDGLDKAAGLPFARVSLLLSNAWKSYLLAALDRGPVAEAERCFGEVLELATTIGDRRYAADAWSGLGTSALLRGDESRVEQAIESLHPAPGGRVPAHIAVRGALLTACLAHRRGQRSDARERFEAVSLQARAASLWAREVTALIGLGATLWHDARVGEAKHAWRTADKLAKQRSRASRALASIGIRACRSDIRATPR
jgi:tetratricopeptide (TPR) repeat protein